MTKKLDSFDVFAGFLLFLMLVVLFGGIYGIHSWSKTTDTQRQHAQHVLALREQYRTEILTATNVCMISASRNEKVTYNDTNEALQTCQNFALKMYGADSACRTEYLQEMASEAKQ